MAIQPTLRLFALLALLIPSSAATKLFASELMVIKYHQTKGFDDHHTYHYALIHQILEITRPEFGDFKEQPYGSAPSAERQAHLLSEGRVLNVHWASPGTPIARANVIPIPVDIVQGLQGYRICLINSQAAVDFKAISNVETFRRLSIGQGVGWSDVAIYHSNHIKLLETQGDLFAMLGLRRFDCLPLGVNEIESFYEQKKPLYPFVAIEPSLLIVYEFPIYFYVSKKFPKIAERFKLGLNRLLANGEFDRLFNHYHKKNIEQLNLGNRKVICLKSPFTANKNQCPQPFLLPDSIKQVKP